MNWAGPFDLGIYGAVNNWFVRRRTTASSIATLAQMVGLVAMPLIAQPAMLRHGWRAGWLAIGAVTLAVGFVPTWLLLVRRPEDLGLAARRHAAPAAAANAGRSRARADILAAPGAAHSGVLAAAALHRAGLSGAGRGEPAPGAVSDRARHRPDDRGDDRQHVLVAVGGGDMVSVSCRGAAGAYPLAATGAVLVAGVLMMLTSAPPAQGYLAAGVFGFGIGAMMTLLPVAWADYFGRANFGAIRGIALPAQVLAQAAGPLLSGILHDATGKYVPRCIASPCWRRSAWARPCWRANRRPGWLPRER